MKTPSYISMVLESLKSLNSDVKLLTDRISNINVDVATVKVEMSRNNEHMGQYNQQLEIHIQGVELAHKRSDLQEQKIIGMESDIALVQKELTTKLDLVYSHIEEERQEREVRRKIQVEAQFKKEALYRNLKVYTLILGAPLAGYGLLKFLAQIFEKFAFLFH